jgi:hypothetical protein
MKLPSLDFPTFELTLPSTGKSVIYRSFLVKEEKILLIAMESGDENDIVRAMKDIIKACIMKGIKNIDKLPMFDIEYLFLNIRAKSVGEVIELKYQHINGKNSDGDDCEHVQEFELDINDIQVIKDDAHTRKIKLTDTIGVLMKYPTLDDSEQAQKSGDEIGKLFSLVYNCVESVWEGDEVHDDATEAEMKVFIDSMTKDQFAKITQFFETMPKMKHKIEYTCAGCGSKESIELEGLQSFFT